MHLKRPTFENALTLAIRQGTKPIVFVLLELVKVSAYNLNIHPN
jgi:hypothetical protein